MQNNVWFGSIILSDNKFKPEFKTSLSKITKVPPGYSGNVLMWLENSVQDFGPRELCLQKSISASGISQFSTLLSF